MPANNTQKGSIICPDCGSLILKDFCPNCGYFAEKEDVETEKGLPPEKTSIFETPVLVDSSIKVKKLEFNKKRNLIYILFLFLLLGGLGAYYYWLYQSSGGKFLSPAPDFNITDSKNGVTVDLNSENKEAVIDFDIPLKEGNFLQSNFAQFAGPDVSIFNQMFGSYRFLDRFHEGEVKDKIIKDFELEEDDLNVYLSSGFAIILPDDNFDRWGYVVEVVDTDYAKEKILALENLREKRQDKFYTDIYAQLVTFKEVQAVADQQDKEQLTENKDRTYLIIANSKEYLDQMKEVSEGVLPNLATSAIFAQAQKSLPSIGNALIYHNRKVDFSNQYYAWFASKFEYEGLNKVLENISSSTLVLFSQSGKLKISGINDL